MLKSCVRWGAGAIAAAAMMSGLESGASAANLSDNSSDTWAGDVNGLASPEGTVYVINYIGYVHGDEYIPGANNLVGKLTGGKHTVPSTAELFTDISRVDYFAATIFGRPLVLEAAVPYVDVNKLNIGNFPSRLTPINGLGPQTVSDGFTDPVLFFTYGLIVEPKNQRFLGLTNYFYLPAGHNFDKLSEFNVTTPNQFTWVPQLSYAEGLGKFAPGLSKFWVDVIANASIHTDGGAPQVFCCTSASGGTLPGVQFDRLTQSNSYDLKAFLRYDYAQAAHIAVGIEKSWGGNQLASGGLLGAGLGPTSLGKDDFLKGHFQITYPLMPDLHLGADITHDFEREGGLRQDITAEARITKVFLPAQEPLK